VHRLVRVIKEEKIYGKESYDVKTAENA